MRDTHKLNSRAVVALFLVVYPITVMAAQDLFKDTTGVTLNQGLYSLFMGFWGALAIFTEKWVKTKEANSWIKIFVGDLVGATLAAYIALLFCVWVNIASAAIGIACALSGYGGGHTLRWFYAKFRKTGDQALGS